MLKAASLQCICYPFGEPPVMKLWCKKPESHFVSGWEKRQSKTGLPSNKKNSIALRNIQKHTFRWKQHSLWGEIQQDPTLFLPKHVCHLVFIRWAMPKRSKYVKGSFLPFMEETDSRTRRFPHFWPCIWGTWPPDNILKLQSQHTLIILLYYLKKTLSKKK